MLLRTTKNLFPVTVRAVCHLVVFVACSSSRRVCGVQNRESRAGSLWGSSHPWVRRRWPYACHEGNRLPQGICWLRFAAVHAGQCMFMVLMGGAWIGGILGMIFPKLGSCNRHCECRMHVSECSKHAPCHLCMCMMHGLVMHAVS